MFEIVIYVMTWKEAEINYLIEKIRIDTVHSISIVLQKSGTVINNKLKELRETGAIVYYSPRDKLVNRLEEKYKLPVNDLLNKMHWNEEKPIKSMADEFDVSRKALSDLMDLRRIKRRTISEDNIRRFKEMPIEDKKKQTEAANKRHYELGLKPIPRYGKDNHFWKNGKVTYICCNCGKVFDRHEGNIKNPDFITCSFECKYAEVSRRYRGENSACWKGGKRSWRGIDWKEVVELVRERDRYICMRCGMTQDESIEVYKARLQVHHKVPYRLTKDNSLENLISLCNKCHTYIEQNLTVKCLDDLKRIKI